VSPNYAGLLRLPVRTLHSCAIRYRFARAFTVA
jgi:hypothetical protein